MRIKILIVIIIAAALSAGVTYTAMKKQSASPASSPSGEAAAKPAGIKIAGLKTAPALPGEGWDAIVVTGKVTVPPDKTVKISPRIEGKIVSTYATVGAVVRKCQVLAVISSRELAEARSQYRQASARVEASKQNHARELQAAKLGANSARPVEEARSELLTAQGDLADTKSEVLQSKSDLAQAETELAQCKTRLARARELYADKIVSRQDLDTADTEFKQDSARVEAAKTKISAAQAKVDQAVARVDIAKQYLSREEKVYTGKLADTRSLHGVKSELAAAKIDLTAAADRIRVLGANPNGSGETVSIVSPISGRVISQHTNVGEMASPSDTLYTVANLSDVWIEADVHEKDLSKVRTGQRAEIRVDAYPDRVFSGRVDSIGDILSAESRTAKVRCAVANRDRVLKGEMFATISLITARRGSTVLIPKEAVLDDAGKKVIFTPCMECPEDQKAGTNACGAYDRFEVVTGPVRGGQIEILKGVEPGTLVVTVGQYQIKSALGSGQLEAGCGGH